MRQQASIYVIEWVLNARCLSCLQYLLYHRDLHTFRGCVPFLAVFFFLGKVTSSSYIREKNVDFCIWVAGLLQFYPWSSPLIKYAKLIRAIFRDWSRRGAEGPWFPQLVQNALLMVSYRLDNLQFVYCHSDHVCLYISLFPPLSRDYSNSLIYSI